MNEHEENLAAIGHPNFWKKEHAWLLFSIFGARDVIIQIGWRLVSIQMIMTPLFWELNWVITPTIVWAHISNFIISSGSHIDVHSEVFHLIFYSIV